VSGIEQPASDPRVAIVTVAYRSDDVLPDFLNSVRVAATLPLITIVVDNSPDQGRAAQIASDAGARYLGIPANPGYGGGVNAAAADLPPSVEWILVANPDVVLGAGSVDALVAMGQGDDRIGAVGPRVLNEDGTTYPSARAVPSLRTGIGHALFSNLWTENPWSRRYLQDRTPADASRDAGWLSGSCLLVRRRAFDELGGFDNGYFMYFEDVDLGYRLGRSGYRNVYEPAAQATHAGAHSTSGDSTRMVRAHHESARRFIDRKYAGWWLWPVRVVVTVGLAVRSAIVARRLRG